MSSKKRQTLAELNDKLSNIPIQTFTQTMESERDRIRQRIAAINDKLRHVRSLIDSSIRDNEKTQSSL